MEVAKKNFEFKVVVVLMIAFIMVIFTGVVTYNQFSTIVNRVTDETRPDDRLVAAHSLENDLTLLGNNAKTYSLTGDRIYLDRFYKTATDIDKQSNRLAAMNQKADDDLDMDKLDSLISEKFAVLNELLFAQDQFRVQEALSKVVNSIEQSSIGDKQTKAVVADVTVDEKPKRKLLGWIKRNKKEEEVGAVEEIELDNPLVEVENVNKEIKQIQSEEMKIEKGLKESELHLITLDNKLTKEITDFLDDFEAKEQAQLQVAAGVAKLEASKTNSQIAIFCVLLGLLMVFIVYLILKYVSRNNLYKIALKKSKEESENLAHTRERFMANMSHEIRTPMNAIAGFADQLEETNLNGVQREYVNMIQKSSEHLIYLINDVLDFSKLQNGKLKLDAAGFKIRDVANEVTAFGKQLAHDKDVVVTCKVDPAIPEILIGDAFRLRQILLNLISNAIKFTSEGNVQLLVEADGESLKLNVKDTGIGMNQETMKRVFLEFEQASAGTAKDHGGTGLGLSISKMLAEMMNGTLILESEESIGTTATLQVPMEIGIQEDIKEPAIESVPLSIQHVLIVDDEEFNRKLLIAILERHQVSYKTANNGKEAVETVQNNHFDLILMDARMPIMNGIEATQVIRRLEDEQKRNVKIITLTAAISQKEWHEFKDAGMNGYVAKPYKEIDLLVEIERVCSSNQNSVPEFEKTETKKELDEKKVDFDIMRKISGGENAFYIDMLETFNHSTNEGLKIILIGYSNDDWEMVANEAHKISSPCKHLGAHDLYFMLKRIENITRSRKGTKLIKDALKSLQNEVDLVTAEIETELLRLKELKK